MKIEDAFFVEIEGHAFDRSSVKLVEDLRITRSKYPDAFECVGDNINTAVYLSGGMGDNRLLFEATYNDVMKILKGRFSDE